LGPFTFAMRYYFFLLLIVFSIPSFSYAQRTSPPEEKLIVNYYNSLISKTDSYRAYVELLRLKNHYPQSMSLNQFQVSSADLLFNGKKFQLLVKKKYSNKITAFYIFDVYALQGHYNKGQAVLSQYTFFNNTFLKFYHDRRALASLMTFDFNSAQEWMKKEFYDRHFVEKIMKYSNAIYEDLRSPIGAMFIGIIPGAGYWYGSKDYGTAIGAFLVVSVFATLTIAALLTGNPILAIVTGSIGIFFYGGSIIGSYLAAKRYNNSLKEDLRAYLFKEFRFATHRKTLNRRYGVQFNEQ